MNAPLQNLPFAAALALSLAPANAEDARGNDPFFDSASKSPVNRFGLSYQGGFNFRANFRKLGGLPSLSNPGPGAPDQDHTYDDGYVRRDSASGDGRTWNWGYQSDSQVPGNDTIEFHSNSSAGDANLSGVRSDPHHGVEVSFQRYLGNWGGAWGAEIAAGYSPVHLATTRTAQGTATRLTDAYALDGVIPPQAPYNGSFAGPGPLISDSPLRTTTMLAGGTQVTGFHELDADLLGFRLGGYYELPFGSQHPFNRWNVVFSGGFALGVVNSEFSFNETVNASGTVLGSESGSDRTAGLVSGFYAGADIGFAFNPGWMVFLGAQYQHLGTYTHETAGREVELDFSHTISVRAGIRYSF